MQSHMNSAKIHSHAHVPVELGHVNGNRIIQAEFIHISETSLRIIIMQIEE